MFIGLEAIKGLSNIKVDKVMLAVVCVCWYLDKDANFPSFNLSIISSRRYCTV
jgi:hypothetical protein